MRLRLPTMSSTRSITLWLQNAWPRIWKIGLGIVAIIIIGQVLYPRDRTVPFAKLGASTSGFTSRNDIQSKLDKEFMKARVTITTPAKSTNVTLSKLGASNKSDVAANTIMDYPLWMRLLPTSIIWHRPTVDAFSVGFDGAQLNDVSTKLAADLSTKPIDAGLAIKKDNLVFTPSKAGYTLEGATLASTIKHTTFALGSSTIKPQATKAQPSYSDADFAAVRALAEKAIAEPITFISAKHETFTADKATIASWLTVKKEADHKISLGVNADAVNGYLDGINKKIGIAAKPTQVQLRDGVETGRQAGSTGSAVDETDALKKVTAIVESGGSRTVTVVMKPVAPPLAYARSYSSSLAGLQAYITYITSAEDVHIALQQLDGAGWAASARASESVVSASTYKLYVSMMLFSRIDAGQSHWSDQMQGTTARTCFDQMIVQSLNNCAEDWIKQFGGGAKVNDFLYSKGISRATTFTASDATHTSANDLLKTLLGLQNGTLYTGANRDILLGDMGRQIYRKGVPAGSSGSVQDKVGFLWDYNHDAAIVHTPKGSYAVAIMTKGQSFGEIANITRQLEAIMYP